MQVTINVRSISTCSLKTKLGGFELGLTMIEITGYPHVLYFFCFVLNNIPPLNMGLLAIA